MSLYDRTLKLSREKTADSTKYFLDLVQACNTFSDATSLPYIFDGRTYTEYGTLDVLAEKLASAAKDWEEGKDVILSTAKEQPLFALTHTSIFDESNEDTATFSFDLSKPLMGSGGFFPFDTFLRFFVTTIQAYHAGLGRVSDSEIEELISGKVMEPGLFDPLKIPEAVYWINYWNAAQVSLIGEDKIRKAPFEIIEKQGDGGYVLVLQKEDFDAHNTAHLEKLAAIHDYFNLYDLQRQYGAA